MIDWLINRAKRTPYYHLDGYMNRWWLVPYRQKTGFCYWFEHPEGGGYLRTDGTGPVRFRKRPLVWLIQRCGIAVRIHEILRSDRERHPHSHPWPYITVILRNWYAEELYDEDGNFTSYRIHGPGSILWRPHGTVHRLTLINGPVTTLFITFKKRGTWGFQVDGKIVPHREYLK